MIYTKPNYSLKYDPLNQQVDFEGILRLSSKEEADDVFKYLTNIHDQINGKMVLNFQRLRYINASAVNLLGKFIGYARQQSKLKIGIVSSSVLAWSERLLPKFQSIWDRLDYLVYDENFYDSQEIIEEESFIPLLRNQTRILWPLEREVLKKHGLKANMRVADICCGCGDTSLMVCREFEPSYALGIDHSAASVAHARRLQKKISIYNVEFQRGDATSLILNDNIFDFVMCRLSLQIFSQSELILKELIRIARPGGRVYVLCEDYDLIVGYPESESVRKTYKLAAEYGIRMGMDLQSGKKLYGMLKNASLGAIQTDIISVDTNNTERANFAKVIESWKRFSVETIGNDLGLSTEDQRELSLGYEAQLRAINEENGYAIWPIIACSGMKN